MAYKPYKIKPLRGPKIPRPGIVRQPPKPGEVLTGYIGRLKASDLEERTARALTEKKSPFSFRMQFIPSDPPVVISGEVGRNQLGAVEVDFMLKVNGTTLAVQIDGAFAHRTAEQIESDRKKDAQMNEILRQSGGGTLVRIPFTWLGNQDAANIAINQLLDGRTDFGSSS